MMSVVLTINGHARSPWLMSRAALDVTASMKDAVSAMECSTAILDDHPADREQRIAARKAAHAFLCHLDELERLSS